LLRFSRLGVSLGGRVVSRRTRIVLIVVSLLGTLVTACGSGTDPNALVIYSGRNQELVKGVLDKIKGAAGLNVEVRYGSSGEMAAQLLEEGDKTEADLFFSQDAGALGAVAEQGRLASLPQDIVGLVPEGYRAERWVATSARARVVAYDPRKVSEAELPKGLDDVVDPKWKGRLGYAPTNASWQAFVTAVRVMKGEEQAKEWLRKFAANEPKRFDNNIAILNAVNDGQLDAGLINHYYWYAKVAESGSVNAKLHHVGGGDPLGLVNVAGAGIISNTDKSEAAHKAVKFLLSEEAQRYFADQTAEYPVVANVQSSKHKLPPLSELDAPDIDLAKLSSLQQTLAMLQEAGLS
jgi:iron(III) transport system substrate-binding protein